MLRHTQLVLDFLDLLKKPLSEASVLDLACLEGGFTVELALQGIYAVGLEGRKANVEKCNKAARALGLKNCLFIEDDVRNLSVEKHAIILIPLLNCCHLGNSLQS